MNNLVNELRRGWVVLGDDNAELSRLDQLCSDAADEICSLQIELAELHAKFYTLSEEFKGPDGYNTWKDAAIDERNKRVKLQRENKLQFNDSWMEV